jgi:hypothetical protein
VIPRTDTALFRKIPNRVKVTFGSKSEVQITAMFEAPNTGDTGRNDNPATRFKVEHIKPAPTFHVPTSTEAATETIPDPYAQDIKDLHDRIDKIEHQITMRKDTTAIHQRELSNATTNDLSRTEQGYILIAIFIFAAILLKR